MKIKYNKIIRLKQSPQLFNVQSALDTFHSTTCHSFKYIPI